MLHVKEECGLPGKRRVLLSDLVDRVLPNSERRRREDEESEDLADERKPKKKMRGLPKRRRCIPSPECTDTLTLLSGVRTPQNMVGSSPCGFNVSFLSRTPQCSTGLATLRIAFACVCISHNLCVWHIRSTVPFRCIYTATYLSYRLEQKENCGREE